MDYLINDQYSYHTETSQLICRANQRTGLYMMGTLVVKVLTVILSSQDFPFTNSCILLFL